MAPGQSVWGTFTEEAALQLFASIDMTNTRKITKAKFAHFIDVRTIEAMQAAFKGADSDGDRQLTKFEFKQFARKTGIDRKAGPSPPQLARCPRRPTFREARVSRAQRSEVLWDKIDENNNGKINFKEFKHFAQDRMAPGTIDALFHADPDDSHDEP